jgi:hypothetical protein
MRWGGFVFVVCGGDGDAAARMWGKILSVGRR